MSDPMTNTEVEDVLASIRRLVSDDKRQDAKAEAKPPNDRLVLTPSLRVMDDVTPQSAPETDAQTDVDHIEAMDEDALSAFAASAFRTVQGGDAPARADTPADDEHDPATAEESAQIRNAIEQDAPAEDHQDSQTDAVFVLGDNDVQGASDDRETVAFVPVAEDTSDDAPDVTVPEDWAEVTHTDMDTIALVPEPETQGDDQHSDAQTKDAQRDTEGPSQSLSEKIAALEMLVSKRSDNFEPDDPGADAYAGTSAPAMAWEDADDVDERGPKGRRADDEDADDPVYAARAGAEGKAKGAARAQVFASDEDVLDEDALRELVSDIVREELQGALGERITRNVRKLVRREIHRALAAQDLE